MDNRRTNLLQSKNRERGKQGFMKKINVFMLMLLLVGQTILGPMGTIKVNAQDTQSTSSFNAMEGEIEGDVKKGETVRAHYNWNLSGEIDAEITKEFLLPEHLTATDLPSTNLYIDGHNVGGYSVAENKLSIVMYKTESPEVEASEEKAASEENENADADETTDEEDSMTSPGSEENVSDVEEKLEEQVESESQDVTKEEQTEDNINDSEVIEKGNIYAKQEQQPTTKTVALSTQPNVIIGAGTITLGATVDENAEGAINFGGIEYPISDQDSPVTLQNAEKHGFKLSLSKVTDLNDVEYSDDSSMKLTDEFKLHLTWILENGHNYKANDTKIINLPSGIKIQQQFEIELEDTTGQLVANAIIGTDNTVNLTFTNYVENHSNVTGFLEIRSMIDQENAEVDNGEIVLQPIGDEGAIRIPIDMSDRKKTNN